VHGAWHQADGRQEAYAQDSKARRSSRFERRALRGWEISKGAARERKTEDTVERRLREHGYYAPDSGITVEKQHSDSARINKLLEHASKSGSGAGKPQFIIRSQAVSDFIIIIECKASPAKHESSTRTNYYDYAVDGVLLYASFLAKEFDVLGIAASGQDEPAFRISHFLHLHGTPKPVDWDAVHDMVSFDEYYEAFTKSDVKFRQDYDALLDYSRKLNNQLQSRKITEAQRGFLISGILIALKNKAFRQSCQSHRTAKQLAANLLETIDAEFENANIPPDRREILTQSFSFIKLLPAITQDKDFITGLIEGIDDNINSFMRTHPYYDTIGQFYIEFLRYANNDKGLGIVLTPHHIGELFALLADVNKDSIVFDNCCGTAGLLIAAIKQMIKDAGADTKVQKRIKRQQLFGIEFQPNIYALAVCNMILHDDGKANVNRGDCFEDDAKILQVEDDTKKLRKVIPTVGLLNPPYKNKAMREDREELEFVLNNLEYLEQGGRCVAIVPITCATNPSGAIGELKRRLLEKHTLEAVMSMPIELFHNSKTTVVTCVMVFTAKRPHPRGKKTWFGYWRDDGLVRTKHRGRIDLNGMWPLIRDGWIQAYRNREIADRLSVMQEVGPEDEWCAEAYFGADYDSINPQALFEASRRYVISQIMNETVGWI
jgi:type I restriction-modification system DNA methylase subunit